MPKVNLSTKGGVAEIWIDRPEVHAGIGGTNGKYFKLKGRYYYAQAFEFAKQGVDNDLSIIVFDVMEAGNIHRALVGEPIGTLVSSREGG